MVFKIICLAIFTIAAIICFLTPYYVNEKRFPNATQRLKLIVRVRLVCLLTMLALLAICMFI